MRMNVQRKTSTKKAVNLSIDAELLADSKNAGINLSRVLEDALKELRTAALRAEIAASVTAMNEDIKEHGIWSDGLRTW
jgi:antitoxin CcdA